MGLPYRARVNERWFLNLPGFHGGAYVVAYVEDTRQRGLQHCGGCQDENCRECPYNFEPRMILEIADCNDRVSLEFDVDSEAGRPTRCTSSTLCWRPFASFARASWPSSSRTTSGSASSQNSGTEVGMNERAVASVPAAARGTEQHARAWRNQADAPVSETGQWGFDSLRPHLASVAQRTQSTGLRPRAQRFESSRGLLVIPRHRGRAARHAPAKRATVVRFRPVS